MRAANRDRGEQNLQGRGAAANARAGPVCISEDTIWSKVEGCSQWHTGEGRIQLHLRSGLTARKTRIRLNPAGCTGEPVKAPAMPCH